MKKLVCIGSGFAVLLALGCKDARIAPKNPQGGAGGAIPAPPDPDSVRPPDAPPIGPIVDAPLADQTPTAPSPDATCAEEVKKATQAPVTLMLVIDASSSMLQSTGNSPAGPSKYSQVRVGMQQFVTAPGSAGITLGLQFFPLPGAGTACRTDADCGYPIIAPSIPPCQPTQVCAKTVDGMRIPKPCGGGRNLTCFEGDTCVPLGRCKISVDDCVNIGQPCPGGIAGDTCVAVGKTCEETDGQLCEVADYETLAVPFVKLPNPGERVVVGAFNRRGPNGGTPMRPAVEGALASLRRHLADKPGERGVVVLATDGAPFGCARNTVADSVAVLTAARTGTPSIATYVVGVATPNDAAERMILAQLASAGGTNTPFVISATEPLAARFLETLSQIRGQALPCEFNIPMPTGAIDFLKVNVRVKTAAGEQEILYTATADRCDPMRGGWYYDVEPSKGTPTRIFVCEATCRQLKQQTDAAVDLRFGCQTRTID